MSSEMEQGMLIRFWSLIFFLACLSLKSVYSDPVSAAKKYHVDELVQKTLESSQELKLLDEDIERSNIELRNARTFYLPRLSLQGNAGVDLLSISSFDPDNNLGANLILDWNFFQNGLVSFRVEQAKAQVELNKLQRKRQMMDIAYRVKSMVYEAISRKAGMELLIQDLHLKKKSLEKTKTEFEQGLHRRSELLKAETQVFEKQTGLEKSKREYDLLIQKLQAEAGLPTAIQKIELGIDSFDEIPLEMKASCLSIALENRPEIKEAQIHCDLSRRAIRVAKLGRLPRLDLFAGNAFAVDDFERSNDQFQFRTGMIARYPLYDGGETKLQILIAEMTSRKAEFQWNQAKLRVKEEVEKAFEEVLNAQAVLQSGKTHRDVIRDEFEKAEIEFKDGNLSAYEAEEARFNLGMAKIQFLDLELEFLKAKAKLAKVLGFVNLEEAFDTLRTSEDVNASKNQTI
jgi:adhesin transport system outer membrane protein